MGGGANPGTGSAGAQQGNFFDSIRFFHLLETWVSKRENGANYGSGVTKIDCGGGGATGAGDNAGNGGSGYTSTITGSSVEYSRDGMVTDILTQNGQQTQHMVLVEMVEEILGIQVIMRFPTSNYSGTTTGSPTVTTDGIYTILTFTGNGSYTG